MTPEEKKIEYCKELQVALVRELGAISRLDDKKDKIKKYTDLKRAVLLWGKLPFANILREIFNEFSDQNFVTLIKGQDYRDFKKKELFSSTLDDTNEGEFCRTMIRASFLPSEERNVVYTKTSSELNNLVKEYKEDLRSLLKVTRLQSIYVKYLF